MLLGRQPEIFGLRPRRDHQGIREIMRAAVAGQPERTAGEVDRTDVVPDDLGPDMLGLGLHLLHQPRPLDDVTEARVILDVGGGRQLAAGLDALDDDRGKARAGGVDCGGQACRPRSENRHAGRNAVAHRCGFRGRLPAPQRQQIASAQAAGRPRTKFTTNTISAITSSR